MNGWLARVARGVVRRLYSTTDMVYVERTLQDISPRYHTGGRIEVRELSLEELRAPGCPLPPKSRPFADEALREGCRIFIGSEAGTLVGWMLVGRRCRRITRLFRYPVPTNDKEIVSFDINVLPAYRKGKVVGVLKEAVMLQLKDEGYEKLLGAIDLRNRSSLSIAWRFGFKEVKRVRLVRVLFIRHCVERKPVPAAPIPLERPDRDLTADGS